MQMPLFLPETPQSQVASLPSTPPRSSSANAQSVAQQEHEQPPSPERSPSVEIIEPSEQYASTGESTLVDTTAPQVRQHCHMNFAVVLTRVCFSPPSVGPRPRPRRPQGRATPCPYAHARRAAAGSSPTLHPSASRRRRHRQAPNPRAARSRPDWGRSDRGRCDTAHTSSCRSCRPRGGVCTDASRLCHCRAQRARARRSRCALARRG